MKISFLKTRAFHYAALCALLSTSIVGKTACITVSMQNTISKILHTCLLEMNDQKHFFEFLDEAIAQLSSYFITSNVADKKEIEAFIGDLKTLKKDSSAWYYQALTKAAGQKGREIVAAKIGSKIKKLNEKYVKFLTPDLIKKLQDTGEKKLLANLAKRLLAIKKP